MSEKWRQLMDEIGPAFAARAAEHDENDSFVAENYAVLKERGAFAAGVPGDLGGGDASHAELCGMVQTLAHHCSATALAFSMHTHLIATLGYLWRAGNKLVEPMLKRVAGEKLILVSSGGSDWLNGSGKLEKVEGGYRLSGRKIFASGVPSGNVMLTTGVYDDPKDGPTVFHFPMALNAPGVKVLDNWKVLGMRGTGSHDVELENVFIPDAAMGGVRRPVGKWHPFMHAVALAALPVIYSAYLGVAEAARNLALNLAARRKNDPLVPLLVGEMENQLVTAQIAHTSMLDLVTREKPGPATTSAALCRRTILATAAVRTVEKAMEVGGGAGFYRETGLERLFRDVQGARYHPLPEKLQTRLTGRVLLGLDIDAG
jgi:alkylation response protein AidB-like acyl-CoA dehydrogenase